MLIEKAAAFIFLILLVGIIGFLTFIPMPAASEKVILMVIGGLMVVATGALPKLFGSDDSRETELEAEVQSLRTELAEQKASHNAAMAAMEAKLDTVSGHYNEIVRMLVERHLEPGKGSAALES